jgi:hypothetical protein
MDFSDYIRKLNTRTIYTDYIAEKQRIQQGCGCDSYYKGHTLQQGERLEILTGQQNTTVAETSTILGSRIANCPGYPLPPPTPPTPDTTIVADLTGLDFSIGGTQFYSTFTFDTTSTITVGFINANASISNADHIDFRRETLPNLTSVDTFTIENPTYIPTTTTILYGPGNIYSQVYTNEAFGMSISSIITFVSGEFLTDIGLSIQTNE